MPTDPAALRDELDARGLAMVGSFATPKLQDRADHERSADEAVRIASAAGVGRWLEPARRPRATIPTAIRCARLVAGRVTAEHGMSDDGWDGLHRRHPRRRRRVRDEAGIRTVIHQHLGTLIESMDEVRRLLDATDPSLVGVCIDTGHWTFGTGSDPVGCHPGARRPGLARPLQGLRRSGHGAVPPRGVGRPHVDRARRLLRARDRLRRFRRPSWARSGRSATTAGSSSSRTSCPGKGDPRESARRNREYLRSIGV